MLGNFHVKQRRVRGYIQSRFTHHQNIYVDLRSAVDQGARSEVWSRSPGLTGARCSLRMCQMQNTSQTLAL